MGAVWRRMGIGVAMFILGPLTPGSVAAQFSDPCGAACALTLGATGVVAATGAVVAFGRLEGGMSTTSQGAWTWGMSFAFVVANGIALSGNGEQQRRGVYGAAIGSAVGSLVWLGVAATADRNDGARLLAASLIGAAAGAVLGGVYGAVTHGEEGDVPVPVLSLGLHF